MTRRLMDDSELSTSFDELKIDSKKSGENDYNKNITDFNAILMAFGTLCETKSISEEAKTSECKDILDKFVKLCGKHEDHEYLMNHLTYCVESLGKKSFALCKSQVIACLEKVKLAYLQKYVSMDNKQFSGSPYEKNNSRIRGSISATADKDGWVIHITPKSVYESIFRKYIDNFQNFMGKEYGVLKIFDNVIKFTNDHGFYTIRLGALQPRQLDSNYLCNKTFPEMSICPYVSYGTAMSQLDWIMSRV